MYVCMYVCIGSSGSAAVAASEGAYGVPSG